MDNQKKEVTYNEASILFDARSMNEAFARMVVMGFMMDMNPTMDELEDVKTAISEAVTNAIIHGYDQEKNQVKENDFPKVKMICRREGQKLTIIVEDEGVGIKNIEEARQPFFTTKPDMERSGMGFVFMETFMDEVRVSSKIGDGTQITMVKYIQNEAQDFNDSKESSDR